MSKAVTVENLRQLSERCKVYTATLVSEVASVIPTKTSDLDNDAGFVASSELVAITSDEINALFTDSTVNNGGASN